MDSKKKRYQEELKRIKQLSAINKVLKKGDVENAFLNNTDKETEISKDTAVERMLEDLQADRHEKKDLELLDSLVSEESPRKSASKAKAKPRKQKMQRRGAPKPKKAARRKR
jgi:hypothetical protein